MTDRRLFELAVPFCVSQTNDHARSALAAKALQRISGSESLRFSFAPDASGGGWDLGLCVGECRHVCSAESPDTAHFEGMEFAFSHESVNRDAMHTEMVSDIAHRHYVWVIGRVLSSYSVIAGKTN